MKGYVFNYGVDGFGADVAPAHEIGCYLDFDKALEKCKELNQKEYNNNEWINEDYTLEETCIRENAEPLLGFYCIEEIEIF